MHEQFNDDPPCRECLPYLWPENQQVYSVYSRVCGQHIMADFQPVDLNLLPVFKVMDAVGIDKEDRLYCVDLVQKAYHEVLKIEREKKK